MFRICSGYVPDMFRIKLYVPDPRILLDLQIMNLSIQHGIQFAWDRRPIFCYNGSIMYHFGNCYVMSN